MILSQYFAPEPIPKPLELAQELQKRGHRVSVLTGLPNYPSGHFYPGYRLCLWRRERLGDDPVVRTFEVPYHGRRALGRMLNYGSFMGSGIAGSVLLPRCDVMYVWHPPLTVGVTAAAIARLRSVPFVYDVQDIWPESAVLAGFLREGVVTRAMARLERFVYRRAGHVLVATAGARENLIGKGVPPGKVSVMPHWVDDALFDNGDPEASRRERARRNWEGLFVVMFAGNLGFAQGLDTVLTAARELRNEGAVRFAFAGDGAERGRLEGLAIRWGLGERVEFLGQQPQAAMPALLGAADALVVHLKRSPLSRLVVPTKTLAYLASGRPLVMAMEGSAADLVVEADAGLVVPPEDPLALARALRLLLGMAPEQRAEMGARGRSYVLGRFGKSVVIRRYEELLARVAWDAVA